MRSKHPKGDTSEQASGDFCLVAVQQRVYRHWILGYSSFSASDQVNRCYHQIPNLSADRPRPAVRSVVSQALLRKPYYEEVGGVELGSVE